MRFKEYLEESDGKEGYVLYNIRQNFAPNHHGEIFKTYAISPAKAFHQILYRLREDFPQRYMDEIHTNQSDYFVIPMGEYLRKEQEKEDRKNPPQPLPKPEPKPQQGTLFPDPSRMPN